MKIFKIVFKSNTSRNRFVLKQAINGTQAGEEFSISHPGKEIISIKEHFTYTKVFSLVFNEKKRSYLDKLNHLDTRKIWKQALS